MKMMFARFVGATVVCSFLVSSALADGLISKLPEDGSWIRFNMSGGATGVKLEGKVTLSSVGKANVGGEDCRWIEFEMAGKFKRGDKEFDVAELHKLLIPEKYLVRGQNPRDHVVKAFKKDQQGSIVELDLKGNGAREIQSLDEFFHAPLANVEKLNEQELEAMLGKLKCDGEKGSDGGFVTETWFNEKAPFGVVNFEYKKRGRTMTLKLAEYGQDAKSKLPDSK